MSKRSLTNNLPPPKLYICSAFKAGKCKGDVEWNPGGDKCSGASPHTHGAEYTKDPQNCRISSEVHIITCIPIEEVDDTYL